MKLIVVTIIFAGLLGTACLAQETPGLKDEEALISYSVGYQIGSDFKQQEVEINPEGAGKRDPGCAFRSKASDDK